MLALEKWSQTSNTPSIRNRCLVILCLRFFGFPCCLLQTTKYTHPDPVCRGGDRVGRRRATLGQWGRLGGCPIELIPWVPMDSMGTRGLHGCPWSPRVPMGTYGCKNQALSDSCMFENSKNQSWTFSKSNFKAKPRLGSVMVGVAVFACS